MVQRIDARYTTRRFRNTSSVYTKKQLILLYKVNQDFVDSPAVDYLTSCIARTRSAHSKNFRQISTSTDSFKFIYPRPVPLWNILAASFPGCLRLGLSWFNWWVSFAPEFQCCYFCEPSCLFYLSFNFDFCVSKIMYL